jgi:hypothetical protein
LHLPLTATCHTAEVTGAYAMATIRHSFTETTITAHCDVYQALRAMPRLTLMVAFLIVFQVALQLAAASVIPRTSLLGRDILAIFYYALFTPFFIAVHRFIILGEVRTDTGSIGANGDFSFSSAGPLSSFC